MISDKQLKYQKALYYEIFNKEEYWFLKEDILSAKIIFDIWGHVGYFSEWCRKYNKDAEIYFFEPVKSSFNQAIELLWNDDKIKLFNYWISNKSEKSTLLLNQDKSMQSSKFSSFLNPNWIPEKVNFITLKEIVGSNHINIIDVVKIDIEWMEFEVLNNLEQTIWGKINTLAIEVHILNDELENQWKILSQKLQSEFPKNNIIQSPYTDKIFLSYSTRT